MSERPDWDHYFMAFAELAASRSTCSRLQVGAVVTVNNRLRGSGYNGAPPGDAHCFHPLGAAEGCTTSIHAEENALKYSIQARGGTIYTTHSPCVFCAAHIKIFGIERVVFKDSYRDGRGIHRLEALGVEVIQLD